MIKLWTYLEDSNEASITLKRCKLNELLTALQEKDFKNNHNFSLLNNELY